MGLSPKSLNVKLMRGKAPQWASLAQVFLFPFLVWSDVDSTVTWNQDFLPPSSQVFLPRSHLDPPLESGQKIIFDLGIQVTHWAS